jgi:hypothetical protein
MLSQKVVTIGPSNPKLEKPALSHLVKTRKLECSCQKEETTKKEDEERRRVMKKLGIRRLDATSSHLVKREGTAKEPPIRSEAERGLPPKEPKRPPRRRKEPRGRCTPSTVTMKKPCNDSNKTDTLRQKTN